jgi:hypothetical protein
MQPKRFISRYLIWYSKNTHMGSFFKRYWQWFVIGGLSVVYALFLYYPIITYNYLVPPGDDPYNHLRELEAYLRDGFKLNAGYPFAFHWVVYVVSLFFGGDSVRSMVIIYPALLLLSSFAVTYFAYRWLGKIEAIIVFVIYSFFALQPLQTLYDGSFPNVMAAGIILPLFFVTYISMFQEQSRGKIVLYTLLSLILALAIMLTHALSTLYLLATGIVTFPILLFVRAGGLKHWKRSFGLAVGSLLVIVASGFLVFFTGLLESSLGLAGNYIQLTAPFPFFKLVGHLADPAAYFPDLRAYAAGLGKVVVLMGIVGMIGLGLKLLIKQTLSYGEIVVGVWVIILFIASRTESLGYPVRAARDLTVPLILAGSVALAWILNLIWQSRKKRGFILQVIGLMAIIIVVLVQGGWQDMVTKAHKLTDPSPMIRFTPQDREILSKLPATSRILVYGINPYHHFFKSSESTVAYIGWPDTPPTNINYKNYDYIIAEIHNPALVWPPVMLDKSLFDSLSYLQLQGEYDQELKRVYVYKVNR